MSTELPAFQPRSSAAPAPREALAPVMQPSVTLRVERLVLQGFSFAPQASTKIEQAFHSEVNRLLAAGELPLAALSARALEKLRLDDLSFGTNAQPAQIGRALASALLRGLAP